MDEETPTEEQPESPPELSPELSIEERAEFGLRDLLGAVNLRDFARMAWSELVQIATTFTRRLNAATSLPFGPFVFLITLVVLAVRMALLTLVVVFFGGSICAITVARSISRIARGPSGEGRTGPDDV